MRAGERQKAQEVEPAVQFCLVHAGAGLYGVDTRAVREVLGDATPQRVPLAPEYIAGVLTYRGEVLEAVSLRTLLGLEAQALDHCVLVLEGDGGECFGLMVDGVGGMVSVFESSLEPNPATLESYGEAIFGGVYRMESGLMAKLDPGRLRPTELARSNVFGTTPQPGQKEAR